MQNYYLNTCDKGNLFLPTIVILFIIYIKFAEQPIIQTAPEQEQNCMESKPFKDQ